MLFSEYKSKDEYLQLKINTMSLEIYYLYLSKIYQKFFYLQLLGIQETKIKLLGLKRNKIMQGYKGIR